jgi:hypothetical protein
MQGKTSMNTVPPTTFPALLSTDAGFGATPSASRMPQSIRSLPGLTPDVVQSPGSGTFCGPGASSDPGRQGGFLGLIQNLLGQLGSYIQSLGGSAASTGTVSTGTAPAGGSSVAVPGEVYLA